MPPSGPDAANTRYVGDTDRLPDYERAVIIAVIAMRMMQMPVNEIVHMITVGHRLMSTIGSVLMARFMPAAIVCGSAGLGIFLRDRDAMFLDLPILALMMQMPVVEVVRVAVVLNRGVPAVGAMLVVVIVVQM